MVVNLLMNFHTIQNLLTLAVFPFCFIRLQYSRPILESCSALRRHHIRPSSMGFIHQGHGILYRKQSDWGQSNMSTFAQPTFRLSKYKHQHCVTGLGECVVVFYLKCKYPNSIIKNHLPPYAISGESFDSQFICVY